MEKSEGYAMVSLAKLNEYYSFAGWTFYLQPFDANNTRLIVRYLSMEVRQSKFAALYCYGCLNHFILLWNRE